MGLEMMKFQDFDRPTTEAQNTLPSAKGIPLNSQSNTVHRNCDLLMPKGQEANSLYKKRSSEQGQVSPPGGHVLLG